MSGEATPVVGVPYGIDGLTLPPGLTPEQIAERLLKLPDTVEELDRRSVTTAGDSATAVYLADEDQAQPRFGMVVVLVVQPAADADAAVAKIETERWGPHDQHTVTGSGTGAGDLPAYREFWRAFPPGLFAIPNQPVYFLIAYRANDGYAYMIIGGAPVIRQAIAEALSQTLSNDATS
jgi:hypothetical protein